jgi:serine phosphatase RsbU (regulator of sigma subunit)
MIDKDGCAVLKPSDLPSPPRAALQLLRICSQSDVNNPELARVVSNDPVMTAELLRVANSPYFGITREVRSIKEAIVILGIKALRNLGLCLAARDVVRPEDLPGFAIDLFWEDSLRRACCARLLGRIAGVNADDCFTAGLLQDFGLLVMFYLNKDKTPLWPKLRQLDPDSRLERERAEFRTTHDAMIGELAGHWGLPHDLATALAMHHPTGPDRVASADGHLSPLLQCADWIAAVFNADDTSAAVAACRQKVADILRFDDKQIESILVNLPTETERAASALGLRVQQQVDFNQLMRDANVQLAEENLDYQELTWKLEQAIRERDALSAELDRELTLAREIQLNLLPRQPAGNAPVTGINVSARQLSGDFYDHFPISGNRIFFMLGDVSGKGINAALLMTKICSLFRCLGKTMHDLRALMALINNEIHDTSVCGMFATVIAGIYEPKTGHIRLVNAGHPPALLLRPEGRIDSFEAEAPPLGINPEVDFLEVEFELDGGCLYLYSDGVIEGRIETGEELGIRGLLTRVLQLRTRPLQQRLEDIVNQLTSFTASVRDDITLLAVEDRRG